MNFTVLHNCSYKLTCRSVFFFFFLLSLGNELLVLCLRSRAPQIEKQVLLLRDINPIIFFSLLHYITSISYCVILMNIQICCNISHLERNLLLMIHSSLAIKPLVYWQNFLKKKSPISLLMFYLEPFQIRFLSPTISHSCQGHQ